MPDTGEFETQWAGNRKVIERLGEDLEDGLSAWKIGARRLGREKLLERVQSSVSNKMSPTGNRH